jgi:hypothetical protein
MNLFTSWLKDPKKPEQPAHQPKPQNPNLILLSLTTLILRINLLVHRDHKDNIRTITATNQINDSTLVNAIMELQEDHLWLLT